MNNQNELSITDAGSILTAMEFLQVAVFMIAVFYLQGKVFSVAGQSAKLVTAISDYAVVVRDIPPDVTELELVTHFNGLYSLATNDYKVLF